MSKGLRRGTNGVKDLLKAPLGNGLSLAGRSLTEWPNCGLGMGGDAAQFSFHLLERRWVSEQAPLSVLGLY